MQHERLKNYGIGWTAKGFWRLLPFFKKKPYDPGLYTLIKLNNAPSLYKAFAFDCGHMENCPLEICPIGEKIPDLFEADQDCQTED